MVKFTRVWGPPKDMKGKRDYYARCKELDRRDRVKEKQENAGQGNQK